MILILSLRLKTPWPGIWIHGNHTHLLSSLSWLTKLQAELHHHVYGKIRDQYTTCGFMLVPCGSHIYRPTHWRQDWTTHDEGTCNPSLSPQHHLTPSSIDYRRQSRESTRPWCWHSVLLDPQWWNKRLSCLPSCWVSRSTTSCEWRHTMVPQMLQPPTTVLQPISGIMGLR